MEGKIAAELAMLDSLRDRDGILQISGTALGGGRDGSRCQLEEGTQLWLEGIVDRWWWKCELEFVGWRLLFGVGHHGESSGQQGILNLIIGQMPTEYLNASPMSLHQQAA